MLAAAGEPGRIHDDVVVLVHKDLLGDVNHPPHRGAPLDHAIPHTVRSASKLDVRGKVPVPQDAKPRPADNLGGGAAHGGRGVHVLSNHPHNVAQLALAHPRARNPLAHVLQHSVHAHRRPSGRRQHLGGGRESSLGVCGRPEARHGVDRREDREGAHVRLQVLPEGLDAQTVEAVGLGKGLPPGDNHVNCRELQHPLKVVGAALEELRG
mmetsp:Transcript_16587/g.41926  ORF Transcript_16587/g.41926 Transcript_16587/m.41926 type:complete len:210 (-) Transcript_16587:860-1489(-)